MTDKRRTRAPSPPTPLSGRDQIDYSFQVARERREQAIADTYETPKWSHWLVRTHLTTFQAAALSLGIEPGSVRSDQHVTQELRGRLDAIRACRDLLVGSQGKRGQDGWLEIRLDLFATWGVSIGWSVPDELRELAKRCSSTTAANAEKPLDATSAKRRKATQIHGDEILRALVAAGYDPTKLPARKKGLKWDPKQAAKQALKVGKRGQQLSKRVFEKTWSALRNSGEIAEETAE